MITVVNTTDETLPDDLNELVQPFRRGENSRISAVPGVGLGLSIAQAATGAMMLRHPIMSPPRTIASTTRQPIHRAPSIPPRGNASTARSAAARHPRHSAIPAITPWMVYRAVDDLPRGGRVPRRR